MKHILEQSPLASLVGQYNWTWCNEKENSKFGEEEEDGGCMNLRGFREGSEHDQNKLYKIFKELIWCYSFKKSSETNIFFQCNLVTITEEYFRGLQR